MRNISIIASGLTAAFWGIVFLLPASILQLSISQLSRFLPFGQSRLWDILSVGLIWLPALVWYFRNKSFEDDLIAPVTFYLTWAYTGVMTGFLIGLLVPAEGCPILNTVIGLTVLMTFLSLLFFGWSNLIGSCLLLGCSLTIFGGWIYGLIIAVPVFLVTASVILIGKPASKIVAIPVLLATAGIFWIGENAIKMSKFLLPIDERAKEDEQVEEV